MKLRSIVEKRSHAVGNVGSVFREIQILMSNIDWWGYRSAERSLDLYTCHHVRYRVSKSCYVTSMKLWLVRTREKYHIEHEFATAVIEAKNHSHIVPRNSWLLVLPELVKWSAWVHGFNHCSKILIRLCHRTIELLSLPELSFSGIITSISMWL